MGAVVNGMLYLNLESGRYDVEVRWEQFVTSDRVQVRLDRNNVVEADLR